MKKFMALLMAVVMLLSVTGCGGHKDKKDTPEKEIYVSVDKNGKKTVVDKDGKTLTEFTLDKDGNITDKDGQIVIPADKVKDLPRPPVKLDGKEVYVSTDKDGKKQVVDKAGKPVEGYSVDESGNISDTSGQTVVDSNDVTAPPAKEDSSSSSGSSSSSSSSDSSGGSSSSSDNSSGGGSSSGGSSSSGGGGTTPAPEPKPQPKPEPPKPQPKPDPEPEPPAHVHSFDIPVYRTEIVDDYEYHTYCKDCGTIMDGWTQEELDNHSIKHALNGESGRWAIGNIKVGSHEEQILDHYECSCGATKSN